MSQKSQIEYLESGRARDPSRNRAGRSAMIDELSDTLVWERKHAINALNGQVSLGQGAMKRGSKATYTELEQEVVVEIWKRSEQPCGKLLKPTIPLWLESDEKHHGELRAATRAKVEQCSARQLDRITAPHQLSLGGRLGRSSGAFLWSLTLTDIHTGWTELAGLWGNSGRKVCVGLRRIEA